MPDFKRIFFYAAEDTEPKVLADALRAFRDDAQDFERVEYETTFFVGGYEVVVIKAYETDPWTEEDDEPVEFELTVDGKNVLEPKTDWNKWVNDMGDLGPKLRLL